MDKYYRAALQTGGRTENTKPKVPRAPKQVTIHDYQFFNARLSELQDKETAYFRKINNIKAPLPDGTDDDLAEREAEQELDQKEIDNAEPLTEAEAKSKLTLTEKGFPEWNRRDFQQFINGSAKHGRDNYDGISNEVDGKTVEEIEQYATVFWKRFKDIDNFQKYVHIVEEGEERIARVQSQQKLLRKKIAMYKVPLQQLKLNYSVSTTNKKVYTEEEDRFLLVMLDKYGIDSEGLNEKIRDEIRASPSFHFDWWILSRNPQEIGRRCTTLLTTVEREFQGAEKVPAANGKKRPSAAVVEEEEEEDVKPPPAKKGKAAKGGVKVGFSIVSTVTKELTWL